MKKTPIFKKRIFLKTATHILAKYKLMFLATSALSITPYNSYFVSIQIILID